MLPKTYVYVEGPGGLPPGPVSFFVLFPENVLSLHLKNSTFSSKKFFKSAFLQKKNDKIPVDNSVEKW